jgi:Zn-dependent protease
VTAPRAETAAESTGWALNLRIGDVPVRIELAFFVIAVLLGISLGTVQGVAIWVGVVLVSVLVHELGHAVAMRLSGVRSRIVLHGMGGLTFPAAAIGSRPRRIAVDLAGPLSGLFLLGVPAVWLGRTLDNPSDTVELIILSMVWVNVAWSFVNLLPILPLDGGNVTKEVLDAVTGEKGEVPARVISIAVAGVAGVLALRSGLMFAGLFALFFLAANVRALSERKAGEVTGEVRRAYAALTQDDPDTALALAWAAVPRAKAPDLRAVAVEVAAWAQVAKGDDDAARLALQRMPETHEVSGHLRALLLETDPADRVNATVDAWLAEAALPPPPAYVRRLADVGLLDPVIQRLLAAQADAAPQARAGMARLLVAAGLLSDAARFGPPEVGPTA